MLVSAIMAKIRSQADLQSSQFVTDADLLDMVQDSYGEVYCLLADALKDKFSVTLATITPTSEFYAAPSDYFRFLSLAEIFGPNDWRRCEPFSIANICDYSTNYILPTTSTHQRISAYHYRVSGANIWFAPVPTGRSFRFLYTPRAATLTQATVLDDVNGWISSYVVADCACRCLQKQELDFSGPLLRKQSVEAKIEAAAAVPDAGRPNELVDVDGSCFGAGIPWMR
jgi:hypothetical protein